MARTIFDINKFSERLRILMEEHGLNTYTLAEAVYLTPATISRYLNGKMEPKRSSIEVIASYFNVNPAWLVLKSEDPAIFEPKKREVKRIPLLGAIAAGLPILAEENIEDYFILDSRINADFALRIKGDSMIDAGIQEGDIAFIRCQPTLENGEIGAILIEDCATLKKFYKDKGTIILQAENAAYKPIILTNGEVRILGKLVAVLNIRD